MSRLRTETGVSSGTTGSSDWEEKADDHARLRVAQSVVDSAVAGAVNTLRQVSGCFFGQ